MQQLSKLELEDLLKKGAYGALMDEEDEGSKFCEEDIDQILQRRTQTITIQTEGKGSTFAKVGGDHTTTFMSLAVLIQSIHFLTALSHWSVQDLDSGQFYAVPLSFGRSNTVSYRPPLFVCPIHLLPGPSYCLFSI